MNEAPDIIVHPDPSISPEQARDTRARAWAFVFDSYTRKKGGPATAPDDAAKEIKNGCDAKTSISR